MPQTEPSPPAATPRRFRWRRLFQYRLRSLLILTAVIAAALAWWSNTVKRQKEAVDKIKHSWGYVRYDWELRGDANPPGPSWLRHLVGDDWFQTPIVVEFSPLSGHPADDLAIQATARLPKLRRVEVVLEGDNAGRSLQVLSGLPDLQDLDLLCSDFGKSNLQAIEGMLSLKKLHLAYATVPDEELKHLAALPRIEELYLHHCLLSDQGVATLGGLPSLRILEVSSTDITDKGVASIARIRGLEWLDLRSTKITDESIPALIQMPNLCVVDISETKISEQGRLKLEKRFPLLSTAFMWTLRDLSPSEFKSIRESTAKYRDQERPVQK